MSIVRVSVETEDVPDGVRVTEIYTDDKGVEFRSQKVTTEEVDHLAVAEKRAETIEAERAEGVENNRRATILQEKLAAAYAEYEAR